MKLLIAFTYLGILIATNANSAGLGGTVYVPNLHAKCLSSHQECLLECAINPETQCTSEEINNEALSCAESCAEEYKACEELLDKLRCLSSNVPIKPPKVDVQAILKRVEEENQRLENE